MTILPPTDSNPVALARLHSLASSPHRLASKRARPTCQSTRPMFLGAVNKLYSGIQSLSELALHAHLWRKKDGVWKISRALSFEHRSTDVP
jgi:hypothetical protein